MICGLDEVRAYTNLSKAKLFSRRDQIHAEMAFTIGEKKQSIPAAEQLKLLKSVSCQRIHSFVGWVC
jgi:hypothetical protein